ncbi:MAG: DNA/RNA non-specific endonuclease [Prevotellaceae bacterium]|nr:DNA/RNA non-specific endonuclease [Prevotellaceae bacterium]
MARRSTSRKKKGGTSKGVYILILIICIVCWLYTKSTNTQGLSGYGKQLLEQVYPDKISAAAEEQDAAAPSGTSEDSCTSEASSSVTDASSGTGLELPAPLPARSELILHRKGYTVSYNKEWKLPNWVAWELNTDKLVERESRSSSKFLPDPDLPPDEAVTTDDYKGIGMDRGHMCPAADNRWHWKAMQESFYMTNICPQDHNLNRGDWKELEDACRRWAGQEGRVYIVCGPILYNQKHRVIGKNHRVIVPEAFFKVVLCADSKPPRAIGFIYKNTSGNQPLDAYVNTVDEVERITGIDFFPALPDDIEDRVEAAYDLKLWQ